MQLCSAEKAARERSRFMCAKAVVFIQRYHLAAFCCLEETNGRGWHRGDVCRLGPVSLEIKWKICGTKAS